MRIGAQKVKGGHKLCEIVIEDSSQETRTHKVFHALDEVCQAFDLAHPIWLDKNVRDFKRHAKCRFTRDSFVEEIDFDYLQLEIIEEDSWIG